jgi:hypothetical protein
MFSPLRITEIDIDTARRWAAPRPGWSAAWALPVGVRRGLSS